MTYTAHDFKRDLEQELVNGFDVVRIARVAFSAYHEHSRDIGPDLYDKMMQIIVMEEGPEFELSEKELREFIDKLVADKTP